MRHTGALILWGAGAARFGIVGCGHGAILPFGWAVDLYGRFTLAPPIGVKLFLKKCVKSNIPAEVGETPGAPPVDTRLSEAYNHCMKIGFDPTKRDKTLKESGLDFEDTPDLFSSLRRITYTDNRKDYGELREVTMGGMRGALGRGGSHSAWGSAKNHLNEKNQCQRNPLV